MCALAAVHSAWSVTAGRLRRVVAIGGAAVLVAHVVWYVRCYQLLREMSVGWTR